MNPIRDVALPYKPSSWLIAPINHCKSTTSAIHPTGAHVGTAENAGLFYTIVSVCNWLEFLMLVVSG
jgi:hypothetical protein